LPGSSTGVAPRAYEPRRLKGSLRLNRWAVLVRTGRDSGLVPALAIMLGANVGTTLIVQILSFNVSVGRCQ